MNRNYYMQSLDYSVKALEQPLNPDLQVGIKLGKHKHQKITILVAYFSRHQNNPTRSYPVKYCFAFHSRNSATGQAKSQNSTKNCMVFQ